MRTLAERPWYKWVIAGLCFLTVMVVIGVPLFLWLRKSDVLKKLFG